MRHKIILIDTGPIVAFLNKSDKYHEWAIIQFSQSIPPFYTCESVISEACFLLKNINNGPLSVFKLLERDLIQLPFRLDTEISSIFKLINKYNNIPMSLADACLVRMSEQISDSTICTLDGDFKIYRKAKRKIIPLIIPDNIS